MAHIVLLLALVVSAHAALCDMSFLFSHCAIVPGGDARLNAADLLHVLLLLLLTFQVYQRIPAVIPPTYCDKCHGSIPWNLLQLVLLLLS